MFIGRYLGWIDSLSGDAHKCSELCLDSRTEGMLSIAQKEVSRTIQIALHIAHVTNHLL